LIPFGTILPLLLDRFACLANMDEEYDAIILGTGLTECIISGLLSVHGHKVLHLDRNSYYGGESASLNLKDLFSKAKKGDPPAALGSSRDYNVDMVPKFIMANGRIVKMLVQTDVTRYLEFKVVDASFVRQGKKIHKIPANDSEALKSGLMGLMEKRRARNFFTYLQKYDEKDPKTFNGLDLKKVPMGAVYEKFGLKQDTIDFIGHGLALQLDDSYINSVAYPTVEKIGLYADSLERYGKSPYLYPLYGLGELPQGFARLSAIYGGTYMLNKEVDSIVYNDEGTAIGVKCGDEVAKGKFIVGDPSYAQDKCRLIGTVARAICILNHPIPTVEKEASCQIIIPQSQVGRKSDIYISMVSSSHCICPGNFYVAIVSCQVETNNPLQEMQPGFDLLGPIADMSLFTSPMYAPMDDGTANKLFISRSYDATSHFETTADDVLSLWRRITGKDLDLDEKIQRPGMEDQQ
jgi:Rab GDP dissociation inhibitor